MAIETVRPTESVFAWDEDRAPFSRIRWGGIFAGTVAALGVLALLYAFGAAVGLTGIDPQNPDTMSASSLFTGIWAFIAPIIALFVGGYVASLAGSARTKGIGATYGLVVWGLTTLVGTWLMVDFLSVIVGGAVSVGQTAIEAGGPAVGESIQGSDVAQAQGPALQVAETTGFVIWGVFGSLLVSLLAALGGSVLGASYRVQTMVARARAKARERVIVHEHHAPAAT